MTDPRFMSDDIDNQISHFIEECGEALAAAGKTQRFGLESVNPLLPKDQQETNMAWLCRELDDVILTAQRLKSSLKMELLT